MKTIDTTKHILDHFNQNTSASDHTIINRTLKTAKQVLSVKEDHEQGYLIRSILDVDGSIVLASSDEIDSPLSQTKNKLIVGTIDSAVQEKNNDQFLALLLDPEDVSALLEANMALQSSKDNSLTPKDTTVLKLADVLHQDDSLDELLPPNEDETWYLLGPDDVINKAISSPAIQDIQDSLRMQQLKSENFVE